MARPIVVVAPLESSNDMKEASSNKSSSNYNNKKQTRQKNNKKRKKNRNNNNNNNNKTNLILARGQDDIPNINDWGNTRPVMVCPNTKAAPDLEVSNDVCSLGIPFDFNTDLFEGKCLIRLRNVPGSCNVEDDKKYFNGRKRLMQAIVQGKFKQSGIRLSDVVTGHEFIRPIRHLPPSFIVNASTSLIERLSPGVEISISNESNQPYALSTLAATSQVISINKPGNEPDICSLTIEENMSLLGGGDGGGDDKKEDNNNNNSQQQQQQQRKQQQSPPPPPPTSSSNRKRFLSKDNVSSQYVYDTNLIYTFDFYQNLFDVNTYSLDLGFTKISMSNILNNQPIQVMSKHKFYDKYLWNFQIWHESLLLPLKKEEEEKEEKKEKDYYSSSSSSSSSSTLSSLSISSPPSSSTLSSLE